MSCDFLIPVSLPKKEKRKRKVGFLVQERRRKTVLIEMCGCSDYIHGAVASPDCA